MSNDIFIKSKAIPSNPRSKNYPAGTSIVRSGGGTTTITGGGGTSVDILKVDDVRSLTDRNVFSSLRTLAEILSRIIKKDDTDTELSDENTLSSLRVKAAIDALKDEYISKTAPDETEYLLKTLGGLIVNNGLDVTDGISTDTLTAETITTQLLNVLNKLSAKSGTFSEDLTVSKKTTTLNLLVQELADTYDLTVSHVATLMGTIVKEYISSESFVSGLSGEGMKIYKALNGDWNMEIDNLTVRKIFSVFELTVQKITHQGGMVIRSAAGAKLTKVTDGGSYWKCEHDSTDDFVKDDQIICQAFTGTSTKRYWRLVTSSGAGYFNLSKTDCEEGSATPEPGDEVAVLGNRTVSARQKAQIDCAVGDTAPYRDDYDGINSYSLVGKLITRTGNLSGITDAVFGVLSGSGLYGTNVYLKGTFILKSGKKIEEAIADVENNLSTRITTVETSFEIREGQISSKVTEATTAATNAKKSETNASGSASSAAGSATTAGQKASEASGSATSAAGSASNAAKSATDAQGSASNAGKILEEVTLKESSITQTAGQISTKVTEVNKKVIEAEAAASNAKKSETNASGSATTASTKAGEAASSATNAGNSASSASGSAGTASAKAGEASTSATNAKNSATSASGSAGTATAKAGEAASSATNAKKSADDAAAKLVTISEKESSINQTASGITLQVKEVQTKAVEAVNSASSASSSATTAGQKASEASGSAGTASAKAGEASTAASNAKKSETNASTSAGAATTKAGEAASSASNAKASENAAASLVANADGKFVTKTVYESGIKALSNSIELKVAKTDFNALGSRVSSTESSIGLLNNEISLRVTADNIKSQINLNGFGVSVFGKLIDFTGKVTFSSMDSATQATINGKATTGYVDSAKSSANKYTDSLKATLGGMAYESMVTKSKLDSTIIEGGFIKTNLINADSLITSTLLASKIAATDITTSRLNATTGAIIGGFKVNGYNLSNRDNSDCWISIDYKSGNVRRISSLGNNLPGIVGSTAGYFSSDNDYTNNALVLRAVGATDSEWMGGKSNFAINALGGCKWKMNAGDHWCMPGVLWTGLFNCNNWTPSLEKSWGNGCSVRLASRDRAGVYRFSHDLGHNDYHIQAMHSAQVRDGWNWWTLTTAFLNIDSSGFSLMFRRIDGAEVDPLQFQIVVFGRPKK